MKVAVIGTGACGLVSMKSCIDEGLEPVCFEQEDSIGGLWRFTEEDTEKSSVYRSTVINTSKEMMCFSDFPIPKDFPPFMHNSKVLEYFRLYAHHFDLYKYIRFNTKVLDIRQAEDYSDTGNWELTYVKLDSPQKEEQKEVFNAVMVCIGHHASPSWPTIRGMDEFRGIKMHSHSYKDFKKFEGKRVLIIGIGNSACDIAVELSRHTPQVYLSTRTGAWIFSRVQDGLAIDYFYNRRLSRLIPPSVAEKVFKSKLDSKFICSHRTLGLEPEHGPFGAHATINDDFVDRIMTGSIIVKPNLHYLTETGVVFDDGTVVDKLDVVIFCTGYNIGFPFIDQSIVPVENNEVTLYKYTFPPHLSQPSLAVIGCINPAGPVNSSAELQSRWVTRVFKGILKLPTESDMMTDIQKKKTELQRRLHPSKRHTIEVDFLEFSDEIANLIGCRPSLWKLLLTDPALAFQCYVGACTPPYYRLTGPGAWPGAREAIMNTDSNMTYSVRSRQVKHVKSNELNCKVILLIVIVFAILLKVML